jgi:hypothetical protein
MNTEKVSKEAILDLQYLPNLSYIACLLYFDVIHIDLYEHYEKQSYRNRCEILTTHGKMSLTIPVVKSQGKQIMKEVEIDHQQKWLRHHWRSIYSAYGKAPFFEFYVIYFEPFFQKEYTHLAEFNLELLTLCLKLLGLSKQIVLSTNYINKPSNERFWDLRSEIHPKRLIEEKRLFGIPAYQQVFGKRFVANLSILDLIFCEGPNAKQLLKESLVINKPNLKSNI